MSHMDQILSEMKKRDSRHYRMLRRDSANMAKKRGIQGYEPLHVNSSEVKGTPLEKFKQADGSIVVGGMVLASCSETQYQKNRKVVTDRTKKREAAIKRNFLEQGESIKRQLGKNHGAVTMIHETKK